jgi:hypothetical protein
MGVIGRQGDRQHLADRLATAAASAGTGKIRPMRRVGVSILRPTNTCAGHSYNPGAGKFFTIQQLALNPVVTGVA